MASNKFLNLIGLASLCQILSCTSAMTRDNSRLDSATKRKEEGYINLQTYLKDGPAHQEVLSPEGEFVCVFNPEVKSWIEKKWDLATVQALRSKLKTSLEIKLTPNGFVKAANRDLGEGQQKDETNYDAVWVRDSAWVFWDLQETGKKEDARRLLLALWDYYGTPAQIQRLQSVIKDPSLVKDKMAVPHIRFDGASPTLDDVYSNGKPEVWNHRQMDAHGLFIMSVLEAVQSGLIKESDFSESRTKVLSLFPAFFNAVQFWNLEDAGAWEEIDRRNTSSISIVTRAMKQLQQLQKNRPSLFGKINGLAPKDKQPVQLLGALIKSGMATVHDQIQRGGESPVYDPYKNPSLFRRADAALFNVFLPTPIEGMSEGELRTVMAQLETLKKPAGVLRYQNDSYQSGNFWIQKPGASLKQGTVGTTGDTSDQNAFKVRLEALIPHTEAQWFFDSQLSMARMELYKLALKRKDRVQAEQDLMYAQLYLKRALGQITGKINNRPLLAADGLPVKDWQIPESINTVVIDGKVAYLPSPITPLNWAKASVEMALFRLEQLLSNQK